MMVVLLIISIILAATAPIAAKKMARDMASGASAWIYTNNKGDVGYNVSGKDISAMIGTTKITNLPSGVKAPRLVLAGDTANPAFVFARRNGEYAGQINMTENQVTMNGGTGAVGANSVAIGMGQAHNGHEGTVTIGQGAKTGGEFPTTNSIAIGHNAISTGSHDIAIGNSAEADWNHTISIGNTSRTGGEHTIAIGTNASTVGQSHNRYWDNKDHQFDNGYNIAIGANSQAGAQGTLAIGVNAKAFGIHSTAIGLGARANSNDAGTGIQGQNDNGIAIGNGTRAQGGSAIAIGVGASATGTQAIAIGDNASATNTHSIAIGTNVVNDKQNVIQLGTVDTTVYIPGDLVVGRSTILGYDDSTTNWFWVRERKSDTYELFGQTITKSRTGWGTFTHVGTDYETQDDPFYGDDSGRAFGADRVDKNNGSVFNYQNGFSINSDKRLKNIGQKYISGLEALKKLDIYNFTFKNDKTKTPQVGVIAQDLEKVFPNSVTKDVYGYLRIRWDEMFYAVINAVKELDTRVSELSKNVQSYFDRTEKLEATIEAQQKTIDELKAKNTEFERQNKEFEKRLAKLEKKEK